MKKEVLEVKLECKFEALVYLPGDAPQSWYQTARCILHDALEVSCDDDIVSVGHMYVNPGGVRMFRISEDEEEIEEIAKIEESICKRMTLKDALGVLYVEAQSGNAEIPFGPGDEDYARHCDEFSQAVDLITNYVELTQEIMQDAWDACASEDDSW